MSRIRNHSNPQNIKNSTKFDDTLLCAPLDKLQTVIDTFNDYHPRIQFIHTEKNSWSNFTQPCRLDVGHKDIWTSIKS